MARDGKRDEGDGQVMLGFHLGEPLCAGHLLRVPQTPGSAVRVPQVAGQRLAAGGGPAQVATGEYRDNWEATFGGRTLSGTRRTVGQA